MIILVDGTKVYESRGLKNSDYKLGLESLGINDICSNAETGTVTFSNMEHFFFMMSHSNVAMKVEIFVSTTGSVEDRNVMLKDFRIYVKTCH